MRLSRRRSLPSGEPQRMSLVYIVPSRRTAVRAGRADQRTRRRPTKDWYESESATWNPGDPLSQGSMIESQRRLYDLGIFARVDTALQNPDGDTDRKYVLYRFEEARRYSLTGGFGAQLARIGRGRSDVHDSCRRAPDSVLAFHLVSAGRISSGSATRFVSRAAFEYSTTRACELYARLSSKVTIV